MKLETYLNAMEKSRNMNRSSASWPRGLRQYCTFRARILQMDENKNETIKYLDDALEIAHQNGVSTIRAKDVKIAELEETIRELRGFL